jgi:D-alanine-D-alanine ligase-like ATP-grasp enzyme
MEAEPDLIFNTAEGVTGTSRESFYPALYEQLGIPYTGANASVLTLTLDKRLSEIVLSTKGIKVPAGVLITEDNRDIPGNLNYPLIVKPNSEGSSIGISRESVVKSREEAEVKIDEMLKLYPLGLDVEEYIKGRELTIPMLEAFPGKLLEIVRTRFY